MWQKSMIGMLAAVVWMGASMATAQDNPADHEKHHPNVEGAQQETPAPEASGAKGMMDGSCAMMQKEMEKKQQEMASEHAKLEDLVKEMNTTTGAAKIDATARAVAEMAAQFRKSNAMHEEMMSKMMQHMGEHMGADQKPDMMMCPMMKSHANSPGGDEKHDSSPGSGAGENDHEQN